MNIRKKYWIIIIALLIPYFAYTLTLFDALLEYFLGKHCLIFSYPYFLILRSVDYSFGNPEGFGIVMLIGRVIYPLYSLLVFIISIALTKRLNRVEKKKYPKFIILTIIALTLSLMVTPINSSLSYVSHKKENRELLESHNDLIINTFKADFKNDEIIIPMTIGGLEPKNKKYLIEVLLRDKDLGNLGSISFEANYLDSKWEYSSILDNVKQDNGNILVKFSIDSNRYKRERLDILVDIHLDFNLFYSEWFEVIAN